MIRKITTGRHHGFVCFCPFYPRSIAFFLSTFILCFFHASLCAQENVTVSQTSIKFLNDRLIIKYEIAGYETDDKFRVWLEITDSTGHRVNARSLYGDVGDEITGGPLKQIIWDLAADSIYLDADINVEIFATRKPKPAPAIVNTTAEVLTGAIIVSEAAANQKHQPDKINEPAPDKENEGKKPETKTDTVIPPQIAEEQSTIKADTVPSGKKTKAEAGTKTDTRPEAKEGTPGKNEKVLPEKTVKTGNELLLSTACPGWGLTRLSGGQPYWLLGVAGYGCIASSYYLNQLSATNFDKYKSTTDISQTEEMDAYYDTGKKQYTASNILAISAITIWVADLGLTWIKASRMKRSATGTRSASFSVGSSYDNYAGTPLISIQYTF